MILRITVKLANFLTILGIFLIGNAKGFYSNEISLRVRRDVPEECRFLGPAKKPDKDQPSGADDQAKMGPPFCCDLPDILQFSPEDWHKCKSILRGPGPSTSGKGHKAHYRNDKFSSVHTIATRSANNPPPPMSQERVECMMNCMFNVSGVLTPDNMLNEEILNQKLANEITNNSRWAPHADSIFKKCVAAAKEANSQSQHSCQPGPHEYLKCMLRELFFNCPSELWVNTPECSDFKNKLEKCPNLHPPPAPRPPQPHHIA